MTGKVSKSSSEPSLAELLELHCETLYVFDEHGDMVSDNNPYPSEQHMCGRLHIGWNDEAVTYRFRKDVPHDVRKNFVRWLDGNSPIGRDSPTSVHELGELFGVSAEKVNIGPAYYAAVDPPCEGSPIEIREANEHLLPPGYLKVGEIEFVQPCYAIIANERASSICLTVRRASHSAEAGVDTDSESRGRGYAGQVTAAWASAVRSQGLISFYSTESENLPSQRVADKLCLTRFAWELGIR